jgi:hypothetical protein
VNVLPDLHPVLDDLSGCASWAAPPSRDMLADLRRTSPLQSWLKMLPALANPHVG